MRLPQPPFAFGWIPHTPGWVAPVDRQTRTLSRSQLGKGHLPCLRRKVWFKKNSENNIGGRIKNMEAARPFFFLCAI